METPGPSRQPFAVNLTFSPEILSPDPTTPGFGRIIRLGGVGAPRLSTSIGNELPIVSIARSFAIIAASMLLATVQGQTFERLTINWIVDVRRRGR
jgi:hypothetical protein